MIKYKIRDSDWLTFPLIIVYFNHLFIQRLQALVLLFLKGLRERNILNFIFQLNSTRVQFTNTLIFYNQNHNFWTTIDDVSGSVHTSAFSFENAYISMRFGLPSTLTRVFTENASI